MTGDLVTLEIERLGHLGDGIATHQGETLHLPGTLPSEHVEVAFTPNGPRIHRIERQSIKRIDPVCTHFGACGSCAIQHLAPKSYRAWKRALIANALAKRGICEPKVGSIAVVPTASRRRATFAAERDGKGVRFGYHRRASGSVIEIDACPILSPAIATKFDALRALAQLVTRNTETANIRVTATKSGLDVDVIAKRPDELQRDRLIGWARETKVARLTLNEEPLAVLVPPIVEIDGADVALPPGAFLQATSQSEIALAKLVLDAAEGAAAVADLFCGLGTFALRLARQTPVTAVDHWSPALNALQSAINHQQQLKPVEIVARDLAISPLTARDLQRFDCVVFDPPRAGAELQSREIAASQVPLVIAVSCNPSTFARDCRILIDAGYVLESIAAVDQFLFSAHIESVAVLRRGS